MKKLLGILVKMTLAGTVITNVAGCGDENEDALTPNTKTDISDKISDNISLGELSPNPSMDFLMKLHMELVKINDLKSITRDDYDVYKKDTLYKVTDSDITKNNMISIDIIIKEKSNLFFGRAIDITVNYIKNKSEEIAHWDSEVDGLVFKDNELYAGCHDRKIYKIDPTTKKRIDIITLVSAVESLAFKGNDLYAGCENSVIYKIDVNAQKPKPLEVFNFCSPKTSSVFSLLFQGDILYAGCQNGIIYKINITAEKIEPKSIIDFGTESSVNGLSFNNNDLYAGCQNGSVNKVDIATDNPGKEEVLNLGSAITDLLFNGNYLYVGCKNSSIYKIDLTTKQKTDIVTLGSAVKGLLFNNDNLYAGCENGKLYKIDLTKSY